MKYIKKIFTEFIEFSGYPKFFLLIFGAIIASIVAIVEPVFMAKTIEFLENFQKTGMFQLENFMVFLVIWGCFIVVNMLLNYVHRYYITDKTSLEFHNFLASKYTDKLFFMSMGSYLSKKSGSIYKDFDRGAGAAFQTVFFFFLTFLKVSISLLVAFGIMLSFNVKMTLVALSMLPFMGIVGYIVAKKTNEPQKENNKRWTGAFGVIGDFFSNMQLGKILRLEKDFRDKFSYQIKEALYLQKFTSKWWSLSDMMTALFVTIARFLVIGSGVYFIIKGELTVAGLILFFSYLGQIYYQISALFGSFPSLQKWNSELEEFYQTFETADAEDVEKGENFSPKTGKIVFENINFSYNSERQILKNLSFEIASGQKIAFVGNTGAGKSTIVSLLFRFWEPNSGKISIDDQDISEVKKSDLRKHIGIVAQDNSLFNLTIRENLLFAKPNATEDELKKALKKASADFVFSLEKGLDTKIGERGLKLSGGEKQRLSIARIFLKNPEILVFDEATSALDNKTEKVIQKSLDSLMKDKTTIIIAHRLSTIRNVDKIFMLENGEIIESGSYDELVAKGGKFAELADPSRLVIA